MAGEALPHAAGVLDGHRRDEHVGGRDGFVAAEDFDIVGQDKPREPVGPTGLEERGRFVGAVTPHDDAQGLGDAALSTGTLGEQAGTNQTHLS
jgi:hypothetical protein